MKKGKFLALALAGAITLMGAGYAAWTDTIKLNATVNTGKLDLYYVDVEEFGQNNGNLPAYTTGDVKYTDGVDENGTKNAKEWDTANITLGNMYPGATATCNLKIKNASSIPVKLVQPVILVPGNLSYQNEMIANVKSIKCENKDIDINSDIAAGKEIDLVLEFKAEENAKQSTPYNFSITADFKQFNK